MVRVVELVGWAEKPNTTTYACANNFSVGKQPLRWALQPNRPSPPVRPML